MTFLVAWSINLECQTEYLDHDAVVQISLTAKQIAKAQMQGKYAVIMYGSREDARVTQDQTS